MATIVIDASAILAVLLAEPTRTRLIKATRGTDLVAPGCLSWEIGNALSALMKRGRLELAQALALFSQFTEISVRLVDVDYGSSLTLADTKGLYAYDAYYLECALRLRLPLLTLDAGMTTAAGEIGIETIEIT